MKKQLLGILLSLMMVLGLMPGMSLTALAGEPTDEDLNIDPHVPPEKTQASISYDTKNVIKTYGDEAFTNKLDRTGDATVSYASSDTNVATVNSANGEVTIVGVGVATITATAGISYNFIYNPDIAEYTVNVNKATPRDTVGKLSAFRGQTLEKVTLPSAENGVWSWAGDTTATLNELGESTYYAKFTPNDTGNYNTLDNVPVIIEVTENSRTSDTTEKHPLKENYTDSESAETTFSTESASVNAASLPQTGDNSRLLLWIGLGITGMAGVFIFARKRA